MKLMRFLPLLMLAACSVGAVQLPDAGQVVDKAKQVTLDSVKAMATQACKVYKLRAPDLSAGPCISDSLINDWVLDIAHNPRKPIDDMPETQCPSYLSGVAHHFIELDPDCGFIRMQ